MNDSYLLDFCSISHIVMRILIYGKIDEDVVLHRLTGDVKINDETGILRSKQCDCLKFIEILKNLQFQFQQR